jgi:SsrA-binding protein
MAIKPKSPPTRVAAENRKARHNYFIEDTLVAGIMLEGSEVKSLREGKGNIAESYATVEGAELWLINSYIPPFSQAMSAAFSHDPRRRRKLLVHKRQLARLWQAVGREGMTLVPLKLFFNEKGIAKLEIGIAKGKKLGDKRETEKQRDWARDKARLMRDRG